MFSCTSVFQAIEKCKAKIIILQGGTSSSKSYSSMQLAYLRAIEKQNIVVTVTGESLPNLRKGIYRDAEAIYGKSKYLQSQIVFWNKSDRIITFKNGSLIEFNSNLDEQSAKAGKRDILIVDEAQGISWPIFFQLAIRTRGQVFILYNPTAPFWSHEKLIGTTPQSNDLGAVVQLIISDHRHNPFLSAEDHRKTENIKDEELWWVYARGRTGNLTGLIFPNWKMIPDKDFPNDQPFCGGLDFGYTNDPTAGVKVVKISDQYFIKELCYEAGLAPKSLKTILSAEGFDSSKILYCEHDPEMVNALRRLGILATKAKKGQGSINAGIMNLKQYDVYYTESSKNLHMERSKYMWKKDPSTGKSINVPIDDFCHLIDACRYAEYSTIGGNQY